MSMGGWEDGRTGRGTKQPQWKSMLVFPMLLLKNKTEKPKDKKLPASFSSLYFTVKKLPAAPRAHAGHQSQQGGTR